MLLMTAVAMTVWQRLTQAADSASQQATVIDSLQHRLAQQQAENQQARANLQQQMATNITAQNQSISQLTMVNEQLQNELNRTRQAKIAALEALHKEIRRSHIDSHIDTLSRWKYRWQDLSLRMTNISRFIYRYVDGLTTLTPPERDQIRMSMLDVWQQWNTNVMNRVHSIRRRVLSNNPDTLLSQPNKIPKEAL
jgi:Flp pilus assembly protein TadG